MATMTVYASACQSGALPLRGLAQASSNNLASSCNVRSKSKCVASKSPLLSQDRHIQSCFTLKALGFRNERNRRSVSLSARAELAANANRGNVIDVTSAEEMKRYIAESGDKLVVVDVSTKTCGPCKLIFPKFVILSTEYDGAIFLRILGDFDNGTRALMREWGVRGVPNFRFFRNGELIHSHTGAKEDDLRGHFLFHYHRSPNVSAK